MTQFRPKFYIITFLFILLFDIIRLLFRSAAVIYTMNQDGHTDKLHIKAAMCKQ